MNKTIVLVAIVALVAIAGGWLLLRRTRSRTETGVLPADTMRGFWNRPVSFSLVIFTGDHLSVLPAFFAECGYEVLARDSVTALPSEIYGGLPGPCGPGNRIVCKAAYSFGDFTVLMDPEMVVLTETGPLAQFCSKHESRVTCVVWERVSQTAGVVEVNESGVARDAWYQAGSPSQPPKNPPEALASAPDATGVLKSLVELGFPRALLTTRVSATRFRLKE